MNAARMTIGIGFRFFFLLLPVFLPIVPMEANAVGLLRPSPSSSFSSFARLQRYFTLRAEILSIWIFPYRVA